MPLHKTLTMWDMSLSLLTVESASAQGQQTTLIFHSLYQTPASPKISSFLPQLMSPVELSAAGCRQQEGETLAQSQCPIVRNFLSHESGRTDVGGARQNIWTHKKIRTWLPSEPRATHSQLLAWAGGLLFLEICQPTHLINNELTEVLCPARSYSWYWETNHWLSKQDQLVPSSQRHNLPQFLPSSHCVL